jgi:hypothetical protein
VALRAQVESRLSRIFEVNRSCMFKYTHPAGFLWRSHQFFAEAAACTAHSKHKKRTFMPSSALELAIPTTERSLVYVLHSTTTRIGTNRPLINGFLPLPSTHKTHCRMYLFGRCLYLCIFKYVSIYLYGVWGSVRDALKIQFFWGVTPCL